MYADLFCGPGIYTEDGAHSTPIKVLEYVIDDPELLRATKLVFNDRETQWVEDLKGNISKFDVNKCLDKTIRFFTVDISPKTISEFGFLKNQPTLTFLDPFGCNGISAEMVLDLMSYFGSECILFFNYRLFNQHLTDKTAEEWVNDFVGVDQAERLRAKIAGMSPDEREDAIINALGESLKREGGAKYTLKYLITDRRGARTSQYVVFATKDEKGYKIMKSVMKHLSTEGGEVMQALGMNAATHDQTTLLAGLYPPEESLGEQLLTEYRGRKTTFGQLCQEQLTREHYIETDFRKAIDGLRKQGLVTVDAGGKKLREGQVPDYATINFE